MNWQEIKISADNTHFLFDGRPLFDKRFKEVLKFHSPGLAPVIDDSGAYHILSDGIALYKERFDRTFGYYCNRAAIMDKQNWFHICENGSKAYAESYSWVGNFQENLCTIRKDDHYYHIGLSGERIYETTYLYAGDFKDGIACVKTASGNYKHIDKTGNFINDKEFLDLGVFHKNFATAMDENGWFHIDKQGNELYSARYLAVEPFYNGFALVSLFEKKKIIINEKGDKIVSI